jgi:hypothetical protein
MHEDSAKIVPDRQRIAPGVERSGEENRIRPVKIIRIRASPAGAVGASISGDGYGKIATPADKALCRR